MIQEIERFGPELEPETLREDEISMDSDIDIDGSGTPDDVAAGIAETGAGRRYESRRIEPVGRVAPIRRQIPIGYSVGARGRTCRGRIGTERHRERLSRLSGENARELPVTNDMRDEAARFSKRQLIQATHRKAVADVEVR